MRPAGAMGVRTRGPARGPPPPPPLAPSTVRSNGRARADLGRRATRELSEARRVRPAARDVLPELEQRPLRVRVALVGAKVGRVPGRHLPSSRPLRKPPADGETPKLGPSRLPRPARCRGGRSRSGNPNPAAQRGVYRRPLGQGARRLARGNFLQATNHTRGSGELGLLRPGPARGAPPPVPRLCTSPNLFSADLLFRERSHHLLSSRIGRHFVVVGSGVDAAFGIPGTRRMLARL